jgi:hypothetical protein
MSVFPLCSWYTPNENTIEAITAAFGDNAAIRCADEPDSLRQGFVEVVFDHYPTENLFKYLCKFYDPSAVILHVYGPHDWDVRQDDNGSLYPQRVVLCFNTSNLK